MAKEKKSIKPFSFETNTERSQIGTSIFNLIKHENTLSVSGISKRTSIPSELVAEHINACVKKDMLRISSGPKSGLVKFNEKFGQFLGVGFADTKCFLTVIDLEGNVMAKEKIDVGSFAGWSGKNKEINSLIATVKDSTKLKRGTFRAAGIAVPEEMAALNYNSAEMLAEGVRDIFDCDVFVAKAATAAGYGEYDEAGSKADEILYMHSDVGSGVVIKREMVCEASQASGSKDAAYLKPWEQFGIVRAAKELVDKGIGTDIVNMVNGDVDTITLDVVLGAAEKNDEFAQDLVKRAGLALGVRAAYLVNMFGTTRVIIGGGVERKEGGFLTHVKESSKRFLLEEMKDKVEIEPAVLGKEAASIGAASLCRRELFREV